jgi:chromosome segregation ATPase
MEKGSEEALIALFENFTNSMTENFSKLEGSIEKLIESERKHDLKYEQLVSADERHDQSNRDRKEDIKELQLHFAKNTSRVERLEKELSLSCNNTKEDVSREIKTAVREAEERIKSKVVLGWIIILFFSVIIGWFAQNTLDNMHDRFGDIKDELKEMHEHDEKLIDKLEKVNANQIKNYHNQMKTYRNLEKFKRGEK